MLQGSLVAIVTPMFDDGRLDIPSLNALIDFHINQGTDGIVIVGTTGESPTVDFDEHCLLIKTAVSQVNGRVPVIAGTGANSTKEAIVLTQTAKDLGADACLLVAPYYNKPTQEGLYQHFKAVADSVEFFAYQTLNKLARQEFRIQIMPHQSSLGCLMSPQRLFGILENMMEARDNMVGD